jgi:glutamate 5-kinase
MVTKLKAAGIVGDAGIPMVIMNGKDPVMLYSVIEGAKVGTFFNLR